MDERRDRMRFWAIVAALLAGVGAAYALILGPPPGEGEAVVILADEPSPPSATPAAAPAAPLRLAVLAVDGDVSLVRSGAPVPARAGDPLHEGDAVVTGAGARVEVAGATYTAELEELGRLEVGASSAGLSRLRLEGGLLSARIAQAALEVAGPPGATVRSEGGALSVGRDGESMSVAVKEGGAALRAAGGAVALGAGQRSMSARGQPPVAPTPVPSQLSLEVEWPAAGRTKEARPVVTGRTAQGAMVVLGAERVKVEPDGSFAHAVVLREGEQRLSARARDVGGLEASAESPVLILDTRAPAAKFDTRGLWKKKR